ncbi:MAG: neuraminidase-like domain-containing protein [Ginsengibacter sp.]
MADNSAPDSPSTQVNNLINVQIPSWSQLFGQASKCECDECESITGAPHYLASLLYFLEHSIPNENLVVVDPNDPTKKTGETPYDILIKRVPYLPFLPLTCENTNIQLPYIQVVLEILEFYAATKSIARIPAYDSGADEWKEDYLATAKIAYQLLSSACYPFTLPYHQPLDITRTYLSKLKTSYSELLEIFAPKDNAVELRLIKEYLNMSEEEYSLLSQFKIGNKGFEVFNLYGFNTSADFESAIYAVAEFLKRAGLQYAELINILQTEFVNPGIKAVNFIENLFINGSPDVKPVFQHLKDIKNAPLDNSFDTGLGATIKSLLQHSEKPALDAMAFKTWIDANFDDVQSTVVIVPEFDADTQRYDPCNYVHSRLGTVLNNFDSSVVPPISGDIFKRLYFFIRLLKKTGLTITELDNILHALPGQTNDKLLNAVMVARKLMQKFQLSAGQAASFYGVIDSTGAASTYSQLFLNNALNKINTVFLADKFGNFIATPVPLKTGDQYNPVLLLALQFLPGQLDLLVSHLAIGDATKFMLSPESISVFYSYALLCQSLNLQLGNLLDIIGVFGNAGVLRTWDKTHNKFNDADLMATLSFTRFIEMINTSEFSINDLLFIIGKEEGAASATQITDEVIKQMLLALQKGIKNIDQQNPEQANGIDEKLVTNQLLPLFDKGTAMQLTGMLNGNIIYGITVPAIASPNIPDGLASRIRVSTDNGTSRIEVTGVLTSSDWNTLETSPVLKNALQPIFDKAANFLEDNFATIIATDEDRNTLLDRTANKATSTADKLKLFYVRYQPYLVRQLKYKLIVQQLAPLISLDEKLTRLITQPSPVMDDLYKSVTAIVAEISTASGYFPQSKMDGLKKMIITLYKPSLFISKFALDAPEVAYFMKSSDDFSGIDFKDFSIEQWQNINNYVMLRKLNRSAQFSFIDLFKQATAGGAISAIINSIVLLTGWPKEDLAGIISTKQYGTNDFRNEGVLFTISTMMQVVNKTGVKATQLSTWAEQGGDFSSLLSLAAAIKNALLLQYDAGDRDEKETTISAQVLQNQRDALVAYLLTLDEIKSAGINEVEALCGWFLIDVPMSACMPTTRIRQAISSVQTFVKRCLMGIENKKDLNGLEVGVLPDYISDWDPISLFRTWQVKMEFLTYPYPYLSYKYIIDKTEAVKTFEETLLKSDITAASVDDAYRTYFQDVSKTANLEIASMYIEDDTDNQSLKIIHVVGKTRYSPHEYYYCMKDANDKWSFWEKIPVAIKENDADSNSPSAAHVIFTKFKKRYYLFMPEFIKRESKTHANDGTKFSDLLTTASIGDVQESGYWEVKMAASEYYNGKWGPKKHLQTSGDLGYFQNNVTEKNISVYFFTHNPDTKDNIIFSLRALVNGMATEKLKLTFVSINSAIVISQGDQQPGSRDTGISYQNVKFPGRMSFPVAAGSRETPPVILDSPGEKFINFSPQFSTDLASVYNQPFFFHDKDRSFYVTSQPITYSVEKTVTEYTMVTPTLQLSPTVVEMIRNPDESHFLAFHFPNT